MESLLKKKRLVKSKVTRIQKTVSTFQQPLDIQERESVYLPQVEAVWKEAEVLQEQIVLECDEEEFPNFELEFHEIFDRLDELKLSFKVSEARTSESKPQQSDSVNLPKFKLPKFTGKFQQWMSFHDLFTATIHENESLSNVQKLQYLKSSLLGEAATILNAIPITDANYEKAWNLLKQRYNNEIEILYDTFDRLFGQPVLNSESGANLRKLIDNISECIETLKTLKQPVEHWDSFLVYIIRRKLDPETLRQWELTQTRSLVRNFSEFMKYLDDRASALASVSRTKQRVNVVVKQERCRTFEPRPSTSSAHHAVSTDQVEPGFQTRKDSSGKRAISTCCYCAGHHSLYRCERFQAITPTERRSWVGQHHLCFNCLRPSHLLAQCSSGSCRVCKRRHHSLLHHKEDSADDIDPSAASNHGSRFDETAKVSVLLPTLNVMVCDRSGHFHSCRALLDSGSQSSFIREDCVQRLGLKRIRERTNIVGLCSKSIGKTNGVVQLNLKSCMDSNSSINVCALIVPKITSDLPQRSIDTINLKQFKNLKLADASFHKSGPIDILLGADVWSEVLLNGRLASKNAPAAIETVFGWVISGPVQVMNSPEPSTTVHHSFADIEQTVKSFWELEEIPEPKSLSQQELECEQHFNISHTRNENGRYVVKLPFQNSSPDLGSSREAALHRLKQVERKFDSDCAFKDLYQSFMKEYLGLGHMEIVPDSDLKKGDSEIYYLPHHAVSKGGTQTAKFRVVFDASAKSTNGKSLHDNLLVGPLLQDSFLVLLLRFRVHKIAFTADIVKMYRQIQMNSEHIDFQRILWRDSTDNQIKDYRLLTVTYGTSSAPYLATKCLQQLALDEAKDFPLSSEVVKRDFYMDDLMTGADTIEEATALQRELIQLLDRGGFELRKWSSNSSAVLNNVPTELREVNLPLHIDKDESVKVLGMRWHPASDTFSFEVASLLEIKNITKRTILSQIARIFYPLGWLSPITIKQKVIIQELWKLKLGWDDLVPSDIQTMWLRVCEELPLLESIRIPRSLSTEKPVQQEMHGFCDASEKAYAAVIYLRTLNANEKISVKLMLAKTKVAPLKTVTIPRLELCGAVLLSRTIELLSKTMNIPITNIYCWTDSTIVLCWLNSPSSRWKPFVANRVSKVQQIVPFPHWHHVSGEMNPADCASRGLWPSTLESHPLWWHGPDYLHQPQLRFAENALKPSQAALVEEKASYSTNTLKCLSTITDRNDVDLIAHFSSLTKLKRVTAYCFRFINNLRNSRESRIIGHLTAKELESALQFWIKQIQGKEYAVEIDCLKKNHKLPNHSKIASLNPFLDDDHLLRVGGRLRHAVISPDQKYPVLLPSKHPFTDMIIDYYHISHLHAGPQLLLASLRQRFWVPSARDRIRKRIRRCVPCLRHRAETAKQMMSDLPATRVNPGRPFLRCGVDYCGPINLRASKGRGRTTFKGYIAIFVCFVTRAIHLELVSDYTTDTFLAALKRFIARRGKCSDIYSDCGTNFVGAKKRLNELADLAKDHNRDDSVSGFLTNEGINWHFNPSSAPHMGGLWEAGVKSVKFHLKRIMGNAILTFEEMYTVLTQIEACLNSPPITQMSDDPGDLSALTPGHFLIGDALTSTPEKDYTSTKENRLNRWQLTQKLFQHFWKRWNSEYLSRLQQRPKWWSKQPNLKTGDLVLVKDERMPPLKWRLARIEELFPGKDGCVRVVSVKTADGLLKRPIVKLVPLPIN